MSDLSRSSGTRTDAVLVPGAAKSGLRFAGIGAIRSRTACRRGGLNDAELELLARPRGGAGRPRLQPSTGFHALHHFATCPVIGAAKARYRASHRPGVLLIPSINDIDIAALMADGVSTLHVDCDQRLIDKRSARRLLPARRDVPMPHRQIDHGAGQKRVELTPSALTDAKRSMAQFADLPEAG